MLPLRHALMVRHGDARYLERLRSLMRRAAAVLTFCAVMSGCGSERERTATAPEPSPVEATGYDDCQSVTAVGSSSDAEITRKARRALKEARAALKGRDVLCASDVDHIGGKGWTKYAPLRPDSPEAAVMLWVQAINASDRDGVCELSAMPEHDCAAIVEEMFSAHAGKVEIVGFYESQHRTTFALNAPEGIEPAVERHEGGYRVHFEYAVIE
jgi:uncharacterized protein YceK